ncbi:hypothetical protein RvY_04377 [Ramazzottius varieornatus]|uniref:Uncharacterized protein n=1 Tax=Ramazzottius varieornatus TaxID=947166 RepID=A0A1D1UY91_RAMVA|nr:hypothetical protein RvY_04377 [Ramazzottius varieornatus]
MAVLRSIVDYLKANGIDNVSVDSVKFMLTSFESSYRDARAQFGTTGEGATVDDIQQYIISLKDKVEQACPFWSRFHPVFRDSPKMVTPYVADNTDATDDAQQFLMSSGQAHLLDLDVPSMVADMFADYPTSPEGSDAPEVPAAQPGTSTPNKKPVRLGSRRLREHEAGSGSREHRNIPKENAGARKGS